MLPCGARFVTTRRATRADAPQVVRSREQLVVQEPVRRERRAAGDGRPAVVGGQQAARLLDDRHERGHVVALELGLRGDVDDPLGDHHVRPEVPVGALPPRALQQGAQPGGGPALGPADGVGVGERRVGEAADGAHAQPARLGGARIGDVGAQPAGGPPPSAQRWCRHDADDDVVPVEQGDEGGPDRHPAHVVLRPVDRVDDPAASSRACLAVLLAEHGVVGPAGGELLADGALDRAVRLGHRRQVRLRLDDEVGGAEAGHGDPVRQAGELEGEGEVVGEIGHPGNLPRRRAAGIGRIVPMRSLQWPRGRNPRHRGRPAHAPARRARGRRARAAGGAGPHPDGRPAVVLAALRGRSSSSSPAWGRWQRSRPSSRASSWPSGSAPPRSTPSSATSSRSSPAGCSSSASCSGSSTAASPATSRGRSGWCCSRRARRRLGLRDLLDHPGRALRRRGRVGVRHRGHRPLAQSLRPR